MAKRPLPESFNLEDEYRGFAFWDDDYPPEFIDRHFELPLPEEEDFHQRRVASYPDILNTPSEEADSTFRTPEPFSLEEDGRDGLEIVASCATDTEVEEVIYGTLVEVNARFMDDTRTLKANPSGRNEQPDALSFDIKPWTNAMAIRWPGTMDNIGSLNQKTSKGLLAALTKEPSIRYQVLLFGMDEQDNRGTCGSKQRLMDFKVEVNVFGPASLAKDCGDDLSKHGLFLQSPRLVEPHMRVLNPHLLPCPPSLQESDMDLASPTGPSPSPRANLTIEQASDYLTLDYFTSWSDIVEADPDSHITVALKPYQKQGLTFMKRRELLECDHTSDLWKVADCDARGNKFTCYEHAIVGARPRQLPPSSLGGLLADEMGSGKTLTTLATIIGSLAIAAQFAASRAAGSARRCKTTLVVAPNVLILDAWMRQIESFVRPGTLEVYKYHGQYKRLDSVMMTQYDLILTTYATVETDLHRGKRLLTSVCWFRLVLDEAHVVRSPDTKQFRAIQKLEANIRWCLTGTPIQNKLEDIGSLVRILRICYLDDPHTFRDHCTRPTVRSRHNLRLLLQSISLRRGRRALGLPEPTFVTRNVVLSAQETEWYRATSSACQRAMQKVVSGRISRSATDTVLQLLSQLRMICNNGTLCTTDNPATLLDMGDRDTGDNSIAAIGTCCQSCSSRIAPFAGVGDHGFGTRTACDHLLCSGCMLLHQDEDGRDLKSQICKCPVCQKLLSSHTANRATSTTTEKTIVGGHSTKLEALVKDIREQQPAAKHIVFSGWTRSLMLAANLFKDNGIPTCMIHGDVPVLERRQILLEYANGPMPQVLLMTLGTGAEGLDITAANRIHILEPQWNPKLEEQAIGRAVRLNQDKEVVVVRYLVESSIEDYVLAHQKRKSLLAADDFADSDRGELKRELNDMLKSVLWGQQSS